MPRLVAFAAPLVSSFLIVGCVPLPGQCTNYWAPGPGVPGVYNSVRATTLWDPDGAGPATTKLVVGGGFEFAGTTAAANIAVWDPATGGWTPLGTGVDNVVTTSTVLTDGSLVIGGGFTFAGSTYMNGIARWNGSTWTPLGSGIGGGARTVYSLVTLANGDLIAAGWFTAADGLPAACIARWDGTTWSSLGGGVTGGANPHLTTVVELPNGDLVVGGSFTTAGGVAATNIARWNGSSWSAIGTGANNLVTSVRQLANGDFLVTGRFTTIDGVAANRVARWDGTVFAPLGSGFDNEANNSLQLPNGDVIVSGSFQNAGAVVAHGLARWDGAAWNPLGNGFTPQFGLPVIVMPMAMLPSGELVVGGNFLSAGGTVANNIARWNGTTWSPMNPGFFTDSSINTLAKTAAGHLVAGGNFTMIGSILANGIARWDGTAWSAMGAGFSGGFQPAVGALAELPNGDLIAGGRFTIAGGTPAEGIARWDGTAWSPLGTGLSGGAFPFAATAGALLVLPNGDLIVGGGFQFAGGVSVGNIARWDGTTWSAVGGGTDGPVAALAVLPGGDLLAAGAFTQAGGASANRIARWNGAAWSPLGAGTNNTIASIAVHPDGSVFAGGWFTTAGGVPANRIARWDGASWSALGGGLTNSAPNVNPVVARIAMLPNGDVVAGGTFNRASGAPANRIARWNGATWSTFGDGCDDTVLAFAQDGAELVVGGIFETVDGHVAMRLARLATTCPPTAATAGNGCNGAVLAATTLPWTDAAFRATGTGLPNVALVLTVTSVTPVVPPFALSALFSQAQPGCDLLVAPDILLALLTTTGVATSELFLPNTPPLVGVTFYHQMLPFEFDAQGNLVAVAATNALQLTAGAF